MTSRQNNLELHLGCHTCWLNCFTLVCLWCGRTVGRAGGRCTVTWLPNFLGWVVYHIFLPMVLRCALRARELRYYFCYLQKLTVALNNPCTEHLLGGQETGAPNDSFLLNTLKTLFRRAVEMHSRCRYNICICSVILGGTWIFSKLYGLEYFFPENFRCNLTYYESETFSDSFLHPKILGFLFSQKNSLTWEIKCENLTSENRRDFLDKLRKL